MLTYPGIHALAWYRVAHYFETHRFPLLAALLSQHAARRTGILIHPAAQIGHRVFFDHGIGTVIGATAVIEDDVTILHGVTLGARKTEQAGRRLPMFVAVLSLVPTPNSWVLLRLAPTVKLVLVRLF